MRSVLPLAASLLTAFWIAACAVTDRGAPVPGTSTGATPPPSAHASLYESPLGFEIMLPPAVYIGGNGETAPVAAFEEPSRNRAFIAAAEHDDPSTPVFDRVPTTLQTLTGTGRLATGLPVWMLSVTPIEDRAKLDAWVRLHYGPGCRVGELAPTRQEGVFDVLLEGDGKPLDQTECPLNYVYELLYQPSERRALSWELGQGPQFMADADGMLTYDMQMRDSVRFR